MYSIKEFNIVIASVGGQGGLTLSRVIGYAALLKGLSVRIGETLGMSQRGGVVQSYVRFGNTIKSPLIPYGGANVILGLEPIETLRAARIYANKNTLIILNTEPIHTVTTLVGKETYPSINGIISELKMYSDKLYAFNATNKARSKGLPVATNIVVLAAFATSSYNPLDLESYIEGIKKFIRRRVEDNINLFKEVVSELKGKVP